MESLAFYFSLHFSTSVPPNVINITTSEPRDNDERVIVVEGTTVTISVTVRSDVMPEVSWIFTDMDEISRLLNTSNMTLYETTSVTVIGEEIYQVRQMLTYKYIVCSVFAHCGITATACTH